VSALTRHSPGASAPPERSGHDHARSNRSVSIEGAVSRVGSGGGESAACSWKGKSSSAGDPDFEPLQAATMATGALSVGGLLAIGVSGDCVEASISDEPLDRRHGRSYPRPSVGRRPAATHHVWSDGHTNAGVPPRENSGRPQIPASAGVPQISASESAPRNRKRARAAI
jgi:hypothetical protein